MITGVEDLPLAQTLIHCHPEAHGLARAICNYNRYQGNLPPSISRIGSIPSEFCTPLCKDFSRGDLTLRKFSLRSIFLYDSSILLMYFVGCAANVVSLPHL